MTFCLKARPSPLIIMDEVKQEPAPKKRRAARKNTAPKRKLKNIENSPPSPYEKLSINQWQVIWMILSGKSVKEISKTLGIPEQTIYNWQTRNEPVAINFREALSEEIRLRNNYAREKGQVLVVRFYNVLEQWIIRLEKQNGKVDPKHVSNVASILNASKWMFKDKSQEDLDKKRQDILSGLEALIEEKLTEGQITRD